MLLLGWAFKKDTNDTRESAAIYVANNLINNNIKVDIYDPKVEESQIYFDLSTLNPDFDNSLVNYIKNPFCNISDYNTIAIITEWEEFKDFDWEIAFKK